MKWLAALPGLLLAAALALLATIIARQFGGSALLYALLAGMLLHVLSRAPRLAPGLEFASGAVLRFGVALLGVRIALEQILALGVTPLVLALVSIPSTILFGLVLSRALGMSKSQGVLSGAGVAICGASAAFAVAAVLPQREDSERQLLFTVIGVTALSSLAMIFYPALASLLELSDTDAGLFLGGSIHNVPQAVGAGYSISPAAGDAATLIKLLRVALMAPAVLLISVTVIRNGHASHGNATIPGFLLGFVALVVANSLGWLPDSLRAPLENLSHACLLVAIAAIGLKASLGELARLGWRPVLLITLETVFLAGLVLAGLILLNHA